MPVTCFTIECWICRDQYTFDERAVVQLPEKFLSGVIRTLLLYAVWKITFEVFVQLFFQVFREVGHAVDCDRTFMVNPIQNLIAAISRLFPVDELVFQDFRCD